MALKINLAIWHPDIYDFIHFKDDLTKLQRTNISVSFTDEFMEAVEKDKDWNLEFPDYEKAKDIYDEKWNADLDLWKMNGYPVLVYKTVKAKELMMEISQCAWNTGEPGVNQSSTMNRGNPNPHINRMIYTNP